MAETEMTARRAYRLPPCPAWDVEGMERWLEDMALRDALETLGEREKRILALRYYDGKTQVEVARAIGISQAQVSRLEKGALNRLRKAIVC